MSCPPIAETKPWLVSHSPERRPVLDRRVQRDVPIEVGQLDRVGIPRDLTHSRKSDGNGRSRRSRSIQGRYTVANHRHPLGNRPLKFRHPDFHRPLPPLKSSGLIFVSLVCLFWLSRIRKTKGKE